MLTFVNQRLSNFELLRIVCMLSILCYHILYHGCSKLALSPDADNFSMVIQSSLGFHVNAFLLISGYFGIKLRSSSFFRFFIPCAFYSVIIWLVFTIYLGDTLSVTSFLKRFHFFYRNSPWWFVENYFFLFITAPIINMAFSADRNKIIMFLFLLLFLNIICGGLLHSDFNSNGFNYNHFVFIYFIGGCIKYFDLSLSRNKCIYYFLFVTIFIFLERYYLHIMRGYINPLVVLQSVIVFLFFKGLKIQNNFLNSISASTFSVYLMHDEDVYAREALTLLVRKLYAIFSSVNDSDIMFIMLMIAFTLILFFILIYIDQLFRYLFIGHLISLSNHVCLNTINKIKKWARL